MASGRAGQPRRMAANSPSANSTSSAKAPSRTPRRFWGMLEMRTGSVLLESGRRIANPLFVGSNPTAASSTPRPALLFRSPAWKADKEASAGALRVCALRWQTRDAGACLSFEAGGCAAPAICFVFERIANATLDDCRLLCRRFTHRTRYLQPDRRGSRAGRDSQGAGYGLPRTGPPGRAYDGNLRRYEANQSRPWQRRGYRSQGIRAHQLPRRRPGRSGLGDAL